MVQKPQKMRSFIFYSVGVMNHQIKRKTEINAPQKVSNVWYLYCKGERDPTPNKLFDTKFYKACSKTW